MGEALQETKYEKLKTLRFWKCNIEDNGLSYVSKYLAGNKSVEILECMDNGITWLGCEFLGRVLKQEVGTSITTLKLDHNPLGSKGVTMLAAGLCMNPCLKLLSLNYCEIEADGAESLQQILIYIKSNLREIYLKGNNLKNAGVVSLLGAVQIAKSLDKIDLADNKISETGEEGELTKELALVTGDDKCSVRSYDFSYNNFDDKAMEKILTSIESAKVVSDFKVTVKLDDDLRGRLKKTLEDNKKRAKKGKKGKKKGKKGKKK